jgi:succinoglycan biosynthesis transport protein ExoP
MTINELIKICEQLGIKFSPSSDANNGLRSAFDDWFDRWHQADAPSLEEGEARSRPAIAASNARANEVNRSLDVFARGKAAESADWSPRGAYPNGHLPAYPGSYSERTNNHFVDYVRLVRKHIWLVIGITVLIPTLVALYLSRKPDIYEAQARVQVDLENTSPLLGGISKNSSVILNSEANDPAYFNTQLQILTGPGLLRRVVKQLDLEHNQDFLRNSTRDGRSSWWQRLLGFDRKNADQKDSNPNEVKLSSSSSTTPGDDLVEAERLSDYVDVLQAVLKVEPVKETRLTVRETRLIDISYRSTDPRLAANIVNAIGTTYVLSNLEKKTETSNTTGTYLQKRIVELQSQIRADEERLINYANNHQILSLDGKQNTVVERLEGLNKQLLVAENERKFAEAAYQASQQPGAAEALAEAGASTDRDIPSATSLGKEAATKLADLRQKRAMLLVENTEKWPEVKEIDKQIAVLENQMLEARTRAKTVVTTNLATRYRQALATEQALRQAYDKQRAETLTQNEAAVNYRIITQEIETNKSLLEGLLQRTKENDVVTAGTPNNVRLIDYAIRPKKPVAPQRLLITALTTLLSFAFGIGLAFFLEYLDDTIRSPEDVEDVLHVAPLAVIPLVGPKRKGRVAATSLSLVGNNGSAEGAMMLSDASSRVPLTEAYRQLRTSVLLSTPGRAPKTLLVTSSLPSEGKTTTAVNIASSLAQTGANVLLIDADLRRPRLHSIFDLSNSVGLSTVLSREMSTEEVLAIVQKHEVGGLFVLTSGHIPPNPAELVGSEQMLKLLSLANRTFDHVVIDSPPIAGFTDGVLISALVDGVLLVVHSGQSSRKLVSRSQKQLQEVGARILGVVLNKTHLRDNGSYYYSTYYKHYGYTAGQEPVTEAAKN